MSGQPMAVACLSPAAVGVGKRLGKLSVAQPAAAHIGTRAWSRTVKDLVAGSGIAFEDRGSHVLKEIPDDWQLYAVVGA